MQERLKNLITPHRVVYAAAIISTIGMIAVLFMTRNTSTPTYSAVSYDSITQVVTGAGTVKAAQTVDLAFQTSGRISAVQVAVGDTVVPGQALATLSSADAQAQLAQARAALGVQQAKMQSVLAGTRPESVAVTQASVTAATNSVVQAQAAMVAFANDAYIKSDDAVRNKADLLLTNPRSSNATLNLMYSYSGATQSIIPERESLEETLTAFNTYLLNLPQDPSQIDMDDLESKTHDVLTQTNEYLDTVATAMNYAIPSSQYPADVIQSISSMLTEARSTISGELSAYTVARTTLDGATAGLETAHAQLILAQASSTPADIAAQQAQVDAAKAAVAYAAAQVDKTMIVAPMNGVITRSDAHTGATADQGVSLISMNSSAAFQVEMYVSERDMTEVHVGDTASISLDALHDGTTFTAHVIAIDPAATTYQGVSSYKITLSFDNNDTRIAAGETATITINTAEKTNVLAIPSSAVIQRNGKYFVMKKTDHGTLLTPITIGISDTSMSEVTSGLSNGDLIQSFGVQG